MDTLLNILIFPGFLFVCLFGMVMEYVDRKLCARLQNRIGPPWFQPLADFIKLVAKANMIPEYADPTIFTFMPVLALAATTTAFLYVPIWQQQALLSFKGDVIVVLYLLTIPTFTFFLGGWYARGPFSMIGAARSITQLFAYEIPLFLSVLAPAMLANTWSLGEITVFFSKHPWLILFNIVGFVVALISLLGKLEKVPFDIPEAETEIVAGSFSEYSGKLLAIFRLSMDVELVVVSSVVSAVFLPFGLNYGFAAGFALYIVKVLFIVSLLSLLRNVFARLRIDQMINFCWKYLAPIALLQLVADLILKGAVKL
ncbi:MAG: complex I subunit 1 family protein [Sedimentisphaerales bacterium]